MSASFKVGEKIVYPNHGVTIVEQVGDISLNGTRSIFYNLRLLANNSRLMVPIHNTDRVGLRPLYRQKEMKNVLTLLEERVGNSNRDWKDRYRDNVEKMKTGRLEDVADVLKNLNQVAKRKSLSFREKKMYDRARYLLVSEVAIVKDMPQEEAEALIEKLLTKSLGMGH